MLNSAMTALTRCQWTATFRPIGEDDVVVDEGLQGPRDGKVKGSWQPAVLE